MRRASTAAVRRRGSLVPAVAVALLVAGGLMAVVLDRLWIDAARVELLKAAEAAALAGAANLARDDRLRDAADLTQIAADARAAAVRAAAGNTVAGQPLRLADSDVHVGRIVQDPAGRDVFLQTENEPASVAVFARRQRSGSNPVSLFLRDASGAPQPDVEVVAEASIDSRTVGVTAIPGGAIPALPLAALDSDPAGTQPQTWVQAIELRGGADRFRYDEPSGLVVAEPDGLPELVLLSAPRSASPGEAAKANLRLLDLGTELRDDRIAEQVAVGLTVEHLADDDGVLRFDFGPLAVGCQAQIDATVQQALAAAVGQPRICFVFSANARRPDVASIPRIVAARIMSVRDRNGEQTEIVVQPCVVSTRTALLADEPVAVNPYVYKLQLTQ